MQKVRIFLQVSDRQSHKPSFCAKSDHNDVELQAQTTCVQVLWCGYSSHSFHFGPIIGHFIHPALQRNFDRKLSQTCRGNYQSAGPPTSGTLSSISPNGALSCRPAYTFFATMYRSGARALPRVASRIQGPTRTTLRFASSTTSRKGTWRGAALRWGAAFGALYWYNTSPLFQDDPTPTKTTPPPPQFSSDDAPTVEAVIAEKKKQAELRTAARQKIAEEAAAQTAAQQSGSNPEDSENAAAAVIENGNDGENPLEELEEEAGQQGAFDPETGTINWDCPCLGGMAHGPCGEEFKSAFSCFVYSNEEPKGIDCIDKFQGMQECFRKYPEIYGSELEDEDEMEEAPQIKDADTPTVQERTSEKTSEKAELVKAKDSISSKETERNSKPS